MWRPGKLRFLIGVKNPLPIQPAVTARKHCLLRGCAVRQIRDFSRAKPSFCQASGDTFSSCLSRSTWNPEMLRWTLTANELPSSPGGVLYRASIACTDRPTDVRRWDEATLAATEHERRLLARPVRHALNRGNVLEDPFRDRIADGRNPGRQGQVSTLLRQPADLGGTGSRRTRNCRSSDGRGRPRSRHSRQAFTHASHLLTAARRAATLVLTAFRRRGAP
jgi:hypothetical protein